ncbi:MAG: hypothetical protein WD060_02080 [Pirellulales bacterium]
MTLDLLDRAFIERWNTATPPADADRPSPVSQPMPAPVPPAVEGCTDSASGVIVHRLLQAARPEWSALADVIESARHRGRRVIAIAACEPGAGCSTIVAALLRTLHGRGHKASACDCSGIHATGSTHDRRFVLVDAGVWFPPGRIHRQRLLIASSGCDAAILVCKGNRPPPATWAVTLEAIGVEPLGEVVSFAPPAGGIRGETP